MEGSIQQQIDNSVGLREAMTLTNEIRDWNVRYNGMNILQRTAVPEQQVENMQRKAGRLRQMQEEEGMTELYVHNKVY